MKAINSLPIAAIALVVALSGSCRTWAEDHPHATPIPASQAATAGIKEFRVPTPYSFPFGLAIDSKGKVWFTEQAGNKIGYLDPATGKIEELLIPAAKGIAEKARGDKSFSVSDIGSPTAIAIAPDDTVWFVQRYGNVLSRLDPATKEFQTFAIPTAQSAPHGLVLAKDGSVWFTERNGNKIGYFDPVKKAFKEYPVPAKNGQPAGIALDGNGNVWFAESEGNAIGKLDPVSGRITEYPLLTPFANPSEVVVDDKGNVWFTQLNANSLGMLRANSGIFDQATIPTFASVPMGITLDKKGRVWFTQTRGNKIASFDPTVPVFREYVIPTTNSLPVSIALDAAGNVWFTENDRDANRIAMLPAGEASAREPGQQGAVAPSSAGPRSAKFELFIIGAGIVAILLSALFFKKFGRHEK